MAISDAHGVPAEHATDNGVRHTAWMGSGCGGSGGRRLS
jgi:hypothetical protein